MRVPFGISRLLAGLILVSSGAGLIGPALQAATVSTFDGQVLTGATLTFSGQPAPRGTVQIAGKTILLGDCDWLEPGEDHVLALPTPRYINLWLCDGSWLPIVRLAGAQQKDTLSIDGPLGPLNLPLARVRGWSQGAELAPASDGQSDMVQLDNLNPMHVDGLENDRLIVHTDLDTTGASVPPIHLQDIKALRMSVPAPPARSSGLSMVLNDQHTAIQLVVTHAGSAAEALGLAAAPEVTIGQAMLHARLRTEGGRRVYLSTLDPVKHEEVGAFGKVWPWTRDTNLDGSPLRLGGVHYDHGIVVHSQAVLGWHLAKAYVRLRALAGISDLMGDEGDCAASLIADGKILWQRQSVKGGDKPVTIDLDLSKVDDLELHVDYGARYDIGDHFTLADSYLVLASGSHVESR